ncbi:MULTISPECIES: hypothetical protein [Comamonadaceae]|jgi:hypothetical protein|uniref:hypothetical protein n=1 Tax=Comamonadaceae TaxID=80864 RepID=UPI000BD3DC8B|nr:MULTISPECIES: hypothetical protein [Comamonadaceae]OZA57501.1 MAG: hypothetical protein B7X79_06375 [Acidovorax sp. 17-64-282]HQT19450.1 hypothetical protein [Acidovorax defluvii]OYY25905.1 MAG: hypothetical protein B7Y64_17850 [Acidovorax sp. 35-64-16]OYY85131.1 MAG: hypothetical protein B7Y46_10410 [Acidovorax sp. 28-64-14]OZA67270.1 MAG: hypothetical protein B7X70_17910 [Acidovorax sp. 39-64-12]
MKRNIGRSALLAGILSLVPPAFAWELAGTKSIALHNREGQRLPLGTVTFLPVDGKTTFTLQLDPDRFKDFFLSMKEFKCLESSEEIQCHVPYPYPNPATVSADNLVWLEHSLLFFYKAPRDFGAKLWNGIYYRMQITERGIVGTPQAIDLVQMGAPPADPSIPPFGTDGRSEIVPESRWFPRLTIE